MTVSKTVIFGFISLFCFTQINAIIEHVAIFESPNGDRVFCFGDRHEYNNRITRKQANEIKEAARYLNAAIIVEDMDHYCGNDQMIRDLLPTTIRKYTEPLVLNLLTPDSGLEIYNIEFRYSQLMLNDLLNGAHAMRVVDKIIQEIELYDDNEVLNNFYQDFLAPFKEIHREIKEILNNDNECLSALQKDPQIKGKVRKITRKISSTKLDRLGISSSNEIECIKYYDAGLLDLLIMHKVYERQIKGDKKNVFIVAGAWHINNITDALVSLGYKQIKKADEKYISQLGHEHFIKMSPGKTCDVVAIERFLKNCLKQKGREKKCRAQDKPGLDPMPSDRRLASSSSSSSSSLPSNEAITDDLFERFILNLIERAHSNNNTQGLENILTCLAKGCAAFKLVERAKQEIEDRQLAVKIALRDEENSAKQSDGFCLYIQETIKEAKSKNNPHELQDLLIQLGTSHPFYQKIQLAIQEIKDYLFAKNLQGSIIG